MSESCNLYDCILLDPSSSLSDRGLLYLLLLYELNGADVGRFK